MKAILCLATVVFVAQSVAADIQAEKIGAVLRFSIGGKAICDYQMEPGDVPEGVNAIFKHGAHLHPVDSPTGKLVTGNHQPDHPWQRGIWLASTKTEFGDSHPDFWNMGKADAKMGGSLPAEVRFVKLDKSWGGAEGGGFISEHVFLDHSHAPDQKMLNETWEVNVSRTNLSSCPSITTAASACAVASNGTPSVPSPC